MNSRVAAAVLPQLHVDLGPAVRACAPARHPHSPCWSLLPSWLISGGGPGLRSCPSLGRVCPVPLSLPCATSGASWHHLSEVLGDRLLD